MQVGPCVPLACGVRRVSTLFQLLRNSGHANVHSIELGDAVLVVHVHMNGQPTTNEG